MRSRSFACGLVWCVFAGGGCRPAPPSPPPGAATPVYNKDTGVLEQLVSDRDGDGKVDTRAFMSGTRILRVEIDRNADDVVDRREVYEPVPGNPSAALIERAEELADAAGRVTRREHYVRGVIERVEEDTDSDGRVDKWEYYQANRLTRVDLDLVGRGKVTQRLTYASGGTLARIETDPDGDGRFEPVSTAGPAGDGPPRSDATTPPAR